MSYLLLVIFVPHISSHGGGGPPPPLWLALPFVLSACTCLVGMIVESISSMRNGILNSNKWGFRLVEIGLLLMLAVICAAGIAAVFQML